MKRFFILLVFLLLLTGCTKESSKQTNDNINETIEESENTSSDKKKEETEENNSKKKVEPKLLKTRDDAGDFHVIIEGDITLQDKTVTVKGTTNLLPGSKLYFYLDPLSGFIIGTADTTLVKDDGSFELKDYLPDGYTDPVVYARLVFDPAASSSEITDHYQELGEPLEGPFVKLSETYEGDLKKEIISVTEIELNKENVVIPITQPQWEKPQDYGSRNVWLNAEVFEDEKYVYVNGKSNLLEGASVSGYLHMEGYIATGFSDRANVNPDGSFQLVISNPKSRIKNLKGYELNLSFSPDNGNNLKYISETYGEKGEKLEGNLLVNKDGLNEIIYKLQFGD